MRKSILVIPLLAAACGSGTTTLQHIQSTVSAHHKNMQVSCNKWGIGDVAGAQTDVYQCDFTRLGNAAIGLNPYFEGSHYYSWIHGSLYDVTHNVRLSQS